MHAGVSMCRSSVNSLFVLALVASVLVGASAPALCTDLQCDLGSCYVGCQVYGHS